MAVADEGVWASHWEHAAKPRAVPVLRRALGRFGEERGMDSPALDGLDLALCEVVAHGVCSADDRGSDDLIRVDAAADGECMSVWVTYGRSDADRTVLALATLLADRMEPAVRLANGRTRVILEFGLVGDASCGDADEAGAGG